MINTGLTFCDSSTILSNWEPVARARQQLEQYLWHDGDVIIVKAAQFLPLFTIAPTLTPTERAVFARAIPDSINSGVFDSNGKRQPLTYDHHLDDNIYANITE